MSNSGVMAATAGFSGMLRRAGRFLHEIPRSYVVAGTLVYCAFMIYLDYLTGPWVPFGVFYLMNIYIGMKYVGTRYAYGLAFVSVVGKTAVKALTLPPDVMWWQLQWQFLSSASIYALFCYLMSALLGARRRVEAELDKLSQLNEAIIDKTDSGVLVFDERGRCVVANDAAARILGYTVGQLRDYNFNEDESWRTPVLFEAGRQTLLTGATQKFTTPLCTVLGKEVWCVGSVGKINRADGSYVLMMFTDISAYREAEDAKKRADQLAAMALKRASIAERKLVSVSEETQRRIGRELHDDLGQHMTGIAFLSEVLFQKLKSQGLEEKHDAAKITSMVNEAVSRTRQLAHGLYPVELEEHGLCSMLDKFAGHVESMYRVNCDFHCDCTQQVDDAETAIHLFRIAQEAVSNALKHGHAANIHIRMARQSGGRVLEILDDGCGIGEAQSKQAGLGMRTMGYRADLLGGSLDVSARPDGGTKVAVSLPMQ